MVYESDFYTTRRPYSSYSRPYVSSYTVTPIRGPYYLMVPYYPFDFDDETRAIRAKTDNLLRKIHVYVPRPSVSDYEETTSPERLRSDDYVRRIINAKNTRRDIESLPWYSTPEKRDIGSGHLACIKYAGGRAQPRRRPYYTVGDLVPGDVKSDVNLMSYYMKNRKAAEDALRKEPDDDTIRKVQEYLEKKAQEKKLEEERRAWEAAERRRIAEEKELARLAAIKLEEDLRIAEIKEQERLEAERQAVIAKAEAARHEAERIVEDEKMYNEAVAQAIADEEERLAKEKEKEREEKQMQDEEEDKMASLITSTAGIGEIPDELHEVEEHAIRDDVSDIETKPYEVDHDEETQIEEDGLHEDQDIENPFIDAGTAAAVTSEQSVEDPEPIVEVAESPQVKVRSNAGEQGFDWSQYEEAEDVAEKSQTQQPADSAPEEEPQHFDEAAVENRSSDEAQIAESEVTEEAQVTDEVDNAHEDDVEETIEMYQVVDEREAEEAEAAAPEEEEVQETRETREVDEVKSERSSVHEEYDRENEQEELDE